MARSNKRLTKPKISSKRKSFGKLGYGSTNKNINTLRKLESIILEERAHHTLTGE